MSSTTGDIVKELKRMGFYIHRDNGAHYIWRHKDMAGNMVTSRSASDQRAKLNALALARKLLRRFPAKAFDATKSVGTIPTCRP